VHVLIIGGTSGLGLELAKLFHEQRCDVTVTGRSSRGGKFRFWELPVGTQVLSLQARLDELIEGIPTVDILIYSAGYFQEGSMCELSDDDIGQMVNLGLMLPMLLLSHLLRKQGRLRGFVAVTSTSQWTPRELEPVYTAVKAGLGMLANSVSLDPMVDRVLVAAPSGMKTKFWEEDGRDTSMMLEPSWVASQIVDLLDGGFAFKFAKILRGPMRVEVVETRH